MKRAVALFVLRQAVKYLKSHPDAIPGHVDDRLIPYLAKALGV